MNRSSLSIRILPALVLLLASMLACAIPGSTTAAPEVILEPTVRATLAEAALATLAAPASAPTAAAGVTELASSAFR
jgi:hypothetical protein